jgi:hypothetical protein
MITNCAANEGFEISPRFRRTIEERIARLERDAESDEAKVAALVDGDHIRRQMRLVALERSEALRMRLFLDRSSTRLPRPLIALRKNREQGTENRKQKTGNRKQGIGNREQKKKPGSETPLPAPMKYNNDAFCPKNLEHRAGIEPANTGFADLRVSRFATGARETGVRDQGSAVSPQACEAHNLRLNPCCRSPFPDN